MKEELARDRDREGLAFLGMIGADVSHEMRNCLSIIAQHAGLQDDLLALAEAGTPPDCTKLRGLSAKIARKVRSGAEVMERLSRVAHATDKEKTSFDLTVFAGDVAALAQRQVAAKRCRLETELPDDVISVEGSPFRFLQAVFAAIQVTLAASERDELVTIKVATQGRSGTISITGGAAPVDQTPHRLSLISAIMDEQGGSIETCLEDRSFSLALTLPVSRE